jgi:peptidoglycan/LPS O-acetylase OafA/YrhL
MTAPASNDVPSTHDGPTRSGPLYVATFDGIRGFVVLTVVMAHVFYFIGWAPEPEFLLGLRRSVFFSVDFLFLISGFVLFLPVVARGTFGSVRSYALRRIGRIVPSYYVSILITIGVLAVLPPFIPAPHDAPAVLAHLTFLQFQAYGQPFVGLGINGVWWTLSTIALFYVTLPLIAERYLRHPFLGLALAVLAAAAWQLYVGDPLHDSATSWSAQFPYFLDDFAIGMTAASVYVALRRGLSAERLRRASIWVLVPAGIALVLCCT